MGDTGRIERTCSARSAPRLVVAELADRQRGAVARWQLLEAGLTRHQIGYLVEVRHLRAVHSGVYLVGHANPAPGAKLQAALLAVPGSALAGLSAAARHGASQYAGTIELVTAARAGVRRPGLRIHRCPSLREEDVAEVDGLRCTTPHRMCLEVAAWHPGSLPRVLNECERLLLSTGDLRGASRGKARVAVEAALERLQSGGHDVRSPPEWELLQALAVVPGLPPPTANVVVEGFEVDLLWADRRFVVMVDGAQDHLRHSRFDRDRRMDNALPDAGYRVRRYPSWRITRDLPAVVAEIASAWEARPTWAS